MYVSNYLTQLPVFCKEKGLQPCVSGKLCATGFALAVIHNLPKHAALPIQVHLSENRTLVPGIETCTIRHIGQVIACHGQPAFFFFLCNFVCWNVPWCFCVSSCSWWVFRRDNTHEQRRLVEPTEQSIACRSSYTCAQAQSRCWAPPGAGLEQTSRWSIHQTVRCSLTARETSAQSGRKRCHRAICSYLCLPRTGVAAWLNYWMSRWTQELPWCPGTGIWARGQGGTLCPQCSPGHCAPGWDIWAVSDPWRCWPWSAWCDCSPSLTRWARAVDATNPAALNQSDSRKGPDSWDQQAFWTCASTERESDCGIASDAASLTSQQKQLVELLWSSSCRELGPSSWCCTWKPSWAEILSGCH